LAFEPGAKFAYNNTGYILLGYIIEKLSGQSYADYLQTHIFTPLGMKHSGYDVSAAILPGRAAGYDVEQGVWTNADYLSMTLPYAAGSLYATLDDLLIWQEAFFADKVISRSSREAMTTSSGANYGFGVGIDDLGGHKSIRHNGGIHGFSTDLSRYPADGLTVIVLANLGSAPSSRIADDLARLWFGLPAPPPPPALVPVDLGLEALDRYVGVYELSPGFNITIARQDGVLTAQATGQSAFALTPTSATEFHYQPAGIRLVFPEGAGPAQSFKLFRGAERTARRLAPQPN
jgi:CubicO group peptidase (beta-lactamase class C family)